MNSVAPPVSRGGAVDGAEVVRTYQAWEGSNVTSITLFTFIEINLSVA